MADSTESRERFEKWLGKETCEVHFDESANKNAWYGWQAAEADTRVRCAQIAQEVAKEVGGRFADTHMLNTGLNKFIKRLAEAIEKG